MRGDDLTREQLDPLVEQIVPMAGFLARLVARMYATAFDPSDPRLLKVRRAEDAVNALHVELRYLTVENVAGRPR